MSALLVPKVEHDRGTVVPKVDQNRGTVVPRMTVSSVAHERVTGAGAESLPGDTGWCHTATSTKTLTIVFNRNIDRL